MEQAAAKFNHPPREADPRRPAALGGPEQAYRAAAMNLKASPSRWI